MAEPLLRVRDLRTYFYTENGVARAVDGVSFEIGPGETVGLAFKSNSLLVFDQASGRAMRSALHEGGTHV